MPHEAGRASQRACKASPPQDSACLPPQGRFSGRMLNAPCDWRLGPGDETLNLLRSDGVSGGDVIVTDARLHDVHKGLPHPASRARAPTPPMLESPWPRANVSQWIRVARDRSPSCRTPSWREVSDGLHKAQSCSSKSRQAISPSLERHRNESPRPPLPSRDPQGEVRNRSTHRGRDTWRGIARAGIPARQWQRKVRRRRTCRSNRLHDARYLEKESHRSHKR